MRHRDWHCSTALPAAMTRAPRAAFETWRQVRHRIADLERDEHDRLRLLDLWTFSGKRSPMRDLQPDEDAKLEPRSACWPMLSAFTTLRWRPTTRYTKAMRQPQRYSRCDEADRRAVALRRAVSRIGARAGVGAHHRRRHWARLRDYGEDIEASPERLAEVEDRLAVLDRLKRKYGPTLEEVIALGDELERKLNEMENKDEVLRKLHLELANAAEQYLQAARTISRQRYEAARKLEKQVESEINELAMKARFKVEVSGTDEEANWTARGFDQVQYLISANPGEPLGPVDEIASGGELSRVMLALKTSVEAGQSQSAAVGTADVRRRRSERWFLMKSTAALAGARRKL